MQSSRRASLLRRSAAAGTCTFALLCHAGKADASGTPEPAPTVGAPLAEDELEPLSAFTERVILLVRTPGDDGVMARLLAELRQSDWHVVEMRPDERFEATPLGTLAERERASAAVRLDARRGVVELWVQRPNGPVEETIAAPDGPDEQVLALRVTEALRARGLLVAPPERRADADPLPQTSATNPPPPKPSTSEKAPPAPEERGALALEVGPAVALSPGGLGPLPLLEGDVRLELAERWSLCLLGFLPLGHQSVSADEGEADVKTSFVGGLVELEWARLSFGGFRSGVGASAAITTMSGAADDADFASSTDTVTTVAPFVRSSFHVTLGRAFRIRSAVVVGATVPEVQIDFGSRSVATWGEPFVVASVALETIPFRW
ncbi:MAG TPA: hypothetical protein VMS65_15000 [Polyangiaceae bacterium]|nr:hypothetical protein [Polyangiaceae bacterium]